MESDLVRACSDLLALKRIFHWRNNTGAFKTERGGFVRVGFPGSPDIIAVINGKFIGIECKMPRGKQSPAQKEFEGKLRAAGGIYWIIRSVEELIIKIF